MSETTIDFAPLGRQPTPAELQQVRADVVRGEFGRKSQEWATGPAGSAVAGWLVGGLLVFVGAITTVVQAIGGNSDDVVIGFGFMAVGLAIGLGVRFLAAAQDRRGWRRTVRLVAFARANDLDFQPHSKVPNLPGAPCQGSRASTFNRMSWTAHGLPAEMATYFGSSSGEPNSSTFRYLAVRLDVDLTAMTFWCGRRRRHGPGVKRFGPDAFEGLQHSLTVAGLRHDERARTLFTDPVVALLTDREHLCNAEYVDGWFLAYYCDSREDVVRESLWRHAFALADSVAATKPALASRG